MSGPTVFHPVQVGHLCRPHLPAAVVLKAYEVYAHVYGPQSAMLDLDRGCRGGFSHNEIIAFLYARCFPKAEWTARVEEAFERKEARWQDR